MNYSAAHIRILESIEAVRARPSMYVGSRGEAGVWHLLEELLQNSVDEAQAGCCTRINVELRADQSVVVEDDGRGIPLAPLRPDGPPAVVAVFTQLHAGAKFHSGAYSRPGGTYGVGLTAVNALSEWLTCLTEREGEAALLRFGRGRLVEELQAVEPRGRSGTRLRFLPDREVMDFRGWSWEPVAARLAELAWLHPGLTLSLWEESGDRRQSWRYDSGLVGFVEDRCRGRERQHSLPIRLSGEVEGVAVELALLWTRSYAEDLLAWTNGVANPQGGTHLEALCRSLVRILGEVGQEQGLLDPRAGDKLDQLDICEGLCAALSLRMWEADFEGQTKTRLSSAVAGRAVEAVVGTGLGELLRQDAVLAQAVVGRALEAARARAAARRASDRARYRQLDPRLSKEVYQQQFGIRSRNWHQSARWITDQGLLGAHAALTRVGPEARVLDACCGSGVVGASFRGRVGHITGLDLTPEMIALSRTRLDEVVYGDVYECPFPDGHFDLVCNREVLHLLPRPERPVSEFFRVLRPGGQLIVGQLLPFGVADAAWIFRIFKKKQPLYFNNFTEQSFRGLLEGAGFLIEEVAEVLQWEDIDLWIDTHETPNLQRHEIRDLYHHAPPEVRAVHPFRVHPDGRIEDCWRWLVFSCRKPA